MEAVGEIIYTIFVVFCGMSLVGILYYIFLVILGLATDIITMLITAGSIFFLYHMFFDGSASQEFNLICWAPGIWVFAPASAFVTIFLIYIAN